MTALCTPSFTLQQPAAPSAHSSGIVRVCPSPQSPAPTFFTTRTATDSSESSAPGSRSPLTTPNRWWPHPSGARVHTCPCTYTLHCHFCLVCLSSLPNSNIKCTGAVLSFIHLCISAAQPANAITLNQCARKRRESLYQSRAQPPRHFAVRLVS